MQITIIVGGGGSLQTLYIFFNTIAEAVTVGKPTDCITSVPVEKAKDVGFLLQNLEGQFMSLMYRHFPLEDHFLDNQLFFKSLP